MKTILITTYAINPYKGSEDGTGWNISREIAKTNKVIVITRKNNIPQIQKYIENSSDSVLNNMTFYGFDLPNWIMQLKKKIGERGYVLYFYFWQLFVALFIKRKGFKFEVAHSLNFHSDSIPNFLWMLGKPTFWGPIGHHPKVPKQYLLSIYGRKNFIKDRLYFAVKWMMRNLDPFFRLAVWKSEKIFAINSSVAKTIRANSNKVIVLPAVATELPNSEIVKSNEMFSVLSVGRFHYMKGFDITIKAFSKFYHKLNSAEQKRVELVLVGKGEEKERLMKLAVQENVNDKIRWIDWVDKKKMHAIYSNSSVFLFPSHEGAGMVIPEAMSYGLPIICFNNVGPGELAGPHNVKVDYSHYEDSVTLFSKSLHEFLKKKMYRKIIGKLYRNYFKENFTWKRKGTVINLAYDNVLNSKDCNKKKTIAIFHPSSELYGADRILVNAIKALPAHVNKRVYLKNDGPLIDFIKKEVENVEVIIKPFMPIIYRKIFTPVGIVKFMRDWIKFRKFIKRENAKYKFKSAYVNTLSTSFILPILHWFKVPNYTHVHEIIDNPKLIGFITTWLCKKYTNRVVCVSQAVLDTMKSYIKNITIKAQVLHNGINPIVVEEKIINGKLHFYLFGRIMPKKGQWFLLEALELIPKKLLEGNKFILMGGVLKGQEHLLIELKKKIAETGLEPYVEIKEFSSNIVAPMSKADICLVPSLMKDPFPTTVLEAMSAGRPVIATDHGGAKEAIINGETGILIKHNAPKIFAQQILKLAYNKELVFKLGMNAKKHFYNSFTISQFNKNWLAFNSQNDFI